MSDNNIIIIGGGAAGFFAAITIAENNTEYNVIILEKTNKFLSKVKVSGGGRCNITHHCFEPRALSENYPRGNKELNQLFKIFHAGNTVDWFAKRGVELKTESDGRMFPVSNSSQSVLDCFFNESQRLGIQVVPNQGVEAIQNSEEGFIVSTDTDKYYAKKAVIAIGGHSNPQFYNWLTTLGHTIIPVIPSLFTFNSLENKFAGLSGISVPWADIKIMGTKLAYSGPLLITHWGLSGPAVIKLSAWAAEYLFRVNYRFTLLVSWIGISGEDNIRSILFSFKKENPLKTVYLHSLFDLPLRLWTHLCDLSEIPESKIWAELPHKNVNKLLENLIRCPIEMKGKTTFKEEFVTCGGIDLNEVHLNTMESKVVPGLYFAGEVLNIDGITGGFNFQAAWTTAWIAAKGII